MAASVLGCDARRVRRLRPFAGRSRELALVLAELDHARRGTPRLVLISGEAGAGKTALAHEAAARAGDDVLRLAAG
jgi:predicted ATPase